MKTAFALLLTAALLASCTPKAKTSTTTSETTTTTTGTPATGADTTGTMPTNTTGTAATDTTGTATTTTPGTAVDSTGTTAAPTIGTPAAGAADTTVTPPITPSTTDTMPMSAQSMEGKISTSDGSAQTFTMQRDGKDYNVTVTPSTTYQGQATSASDFFGTDRANADVTVEGTPSGSDMAATSITLK